MAPEQLQGLPVDARTDVFAFGCVLYEMVTGRRAFTGDTPASVIAAILEREPAPMAGGSDPIPVPVLDAIVRTCLAKNPDDRWWSGHDVAGGVGTTRTRGRTNQRTPARHGGRHGGPPSAGESRRCSSRLPSQRSTVLTADPRTVRRCQPSSPSSTFRNWFWRCRVCHRMDAMYRCTRPPEIKKDERWSSAVWTTAPSPGWPAQSAPDQRLWSPDSRSVAFLRDGELKVVDVATGGARTIGRVPADVRDGAWNHEGIILLGGSRLRRLSAADGHLTDVYRPGAGIISQFAPSFLPDGRTFLYAQDSSNAQQRGVFLGSLDSPTVTRLLPEPANAAISPRGYFLYGHQGTVFAQRFDIDHKRLVGDPVNLGSGAGYFGPYTGFAAAGDLLVWANVQTPSANLTWVDRSGRILGSTPEAAQYIAIALAPDEQRVVATESGDRLTLIELTRPIHTRLTPGNQSEFDSVWSPDSREVAFVSEGGLFTRRVDQDGRTPLLAPSSVRGVEDWTHDGRFVIFLCGTERICALPLKGDRTPVPLIESSASVDEARVSRDGRWLAYSGTDTGQWEVYVQPFMRPGGRVRVSTNGGSQPRWRGDGRELFYLALDGTMMSVRTADPATPGAAQKLFQRRLAVNPVEDQYDVTADGQRFLVIDPEGQPTTRLTVLTNWPAALKPR